MKSLYSQFQPDLEQLLRNYNRLIRKAATHVLVFMISDEERNSKPYSIPVRYLLTKGVTDVKHRELVAELATVMKKNGLVPIGNL